MAVDMFLKLTANKKAVEGESVDDTHGKEIELVSWSWGLSQSGSAQSGTGGGSGKVNVADISFTKYIDRSTPTLLKLCCQGGHVDEAILTVRKAGGGGVEYVVMRMVDCIVTSLTTGASAGGDRLTEVLTLNFAEFHYEYTPQEGNHGAGSGIPMGWNIAKNCEAQ
jgi:type VI secretion system secreted protein Hcp